MSATLRTIMSTNSERFDAIESQVKKVEESIGPKVAEEMTGMKKQLMADLTEEIDKKLEEKMKEESDRRYREMNLCFFNVPISTDPDPKARKEYDKQIVYQIFHAIIREDVEDPQIKNIFRIKPAKSKNSKDSRSESTPVLKVTFSSKHEIRLFLANARNIKDNAKLDENLQKIIVSKDLSVKEREFNKKLRIELAEKNKDGDQYTIRNGKIVEKKVANREDQGAIGDDSAPH